ncbi:MAG: tRNA (adenosine(37)-N6)-dimethylallyltransferase MiaA [Propionibacteriaceae bacterium]|jgi:tRNA dimethylallyltransferase|nr:tRNA (adenosine(37)-N6)-dimethylallyltransferase MiaA [Propionibacteriaceae bacterium]
MLPVIVLVGSTATGKTALAIDLALELKNQGQEAEIINADSMLVYKGMDIGTAKPTIEERRGVTHHLIDFMEITQNASVALFQSLARETIKECRDRGVVPVVVGGSALYLHGIIDDFQFPPTDEDLRARLTRELDEVGAQVLHERLRTYNPKAAEEISVSNTRRIIRALESIELTGDFQATLPQWNYAIDEVHQVGLEIDRQTMDERIAERVKSMWESGFVQEVQRLLERGLRESPTASRAIGYRQVMDYLDGELTWEQAQELTIIKTRQFSRRQISWWKRDPRIWWVPLITSAPEILYTLMPQ